MAGIYIHKNVSVSCFISPKLVTCKGGNKKTGKLYHSFYMCMLVQSILHDSL
jgi:hypothetical protein